jgi:hypothetical protein
VGYTLLFDQDDAMTTSPNALVTGGAFGPDRVRIA